ncbi:MAG: thioesterase family protein [Candidatus Velthaea sp.]
MRLVRVLAGGMGVKLDVGRTYQSQTRVEEWMTAEKAGNKGVDVLSTPMLLQLVEDAAMQCIAPTLEPGQISLGTHVDLSHLAPSPVGIIIRTEVEVLKFDGRRIEFAFSSFDEREKVAEGTHERYITERTKFLERLEDKNS